VKEYRSNEHSDSLKSDGGVLGSAKKQAGTIQKPFAVFDFDGTLIRWQLYHSIADKLAQLGHIDKSDFETVRNARLDWKTRKPDSSFKSYEKTLIGIYEKALRSIDYQTFLRAAKEAANEHREQVYTYTRELLKELAAKDYTLLAISGSQTEIVEMVARHWGFDDWVGSEYKKKGEAFTGDVYVASNDKEKALRQLIDKHGLTLQDSIGVGDSESDIPLLQMVERPIAFNPTKGLLEHAKNQRWEVVVERKSVAYKLNYKNGQYTLV
jgi:HAD superfamily hydrolase (TIGR01490 family)